MASEARCAALTTKSPEVVAAIDQGIKYLESAACKDQGDRVGAHALLGLALLKNGAKPDHPKIMQAVARIQSAIASRDGNKIDVAMGGDNPAYSAGTSIMFLVELDSAAHHSDIDFLLTYLRSRQKKHGAWGYLSRETGDTSMTQYGVLCAWEAKNHGFNVPMESVEAVTTWLLRTQDPSGGFGYQGQMADNFVNLKTQSEVKHSMTAAGLGSLYICSHLLGLVAKVEKVPKEKEVPSALREIRKKDAKPDPAKYKSKLDPKMVKEARARGNDWFAKNFKIKVDNWNLYYLYALERYKSIAEYCDQTEQKDPEWYSDVAEFLLKKQAPSGCWDAECGPMADTAFGVLFLLRSMKKSIAKAVALGEGTMVGGRGIPKDTDGLRVGRGGEIQQRKLLGQGEQLLAALDDQEGKDFDRAVEGLSSLPEAKIEAMSSKNAEMIRRLVSNRKWEARMAAVRTLGKVRNLDNVPVLIYALNDEYAEIAREANEALLRISRTNDSKYRMPDSPTDSDRRAAIEKWKAWYHAVRPGADVDL